MPKAKSQKKKLSSQRQFQLNRIAKGLCRRCGEPRKDPETGQDFSAEYCKNCAFRHREEVRRSREKKLTPAT